MSQLSTITNVPPQLDSDLQHNSNENDSPSTSSSQILLEETTKLFQIALPTAIIQLALVAIFPMTASIIGRLLDTNSLAGFSLSTLAMNMTCLSIILGSMTAADTLQPRAMAMGRYKEVGLLSIRGYIICAMILFVPVILLVFKVEDILMFLGQDAVASHLAQEWSRIYSLGIPFVLFFRVSQRFLSAQHVVLPLAVASVVGSFLFHPYSLKFWVAVGGFAGSAFAVVVTQIFTSLITVWYLCWKKPYHAETWPGVNGDTLREALVLQKVARFLKLGMGGILSFTEWWFWEALCFTAGKLGVIPLCAHTIAYQMVPLSFMIPLGISLGLTIRIGSTLPTSVHRAKKIAIWCTLVSVVLGVVVATLLYRYRLEIIYSFTNDELVIQECEKIWIYTCIHLCNLHVMAMLNGIVRALGLQMRSGIATVVVLWVCALPVIYNGSVIKNGGLVHMWKSLPLTYLLLNVALLLCFALSDWSEIRDGIVKKGRKSIAESKETASRSTENVLLLLNPDESTLYGTTMLDKPDVELKC